VSQLAGEGGTPMLVAACADWSTKAIMLLVVDWKSDASEDAAGATSAARSRLLAPHPESVQADPS